MVYMITWIPSIYPRHVTIYSSTMDPMGNVKANPRACLGLLRLTWALLGHTVHTAIDGLFHRISTIQGAGFRPSSSGFYWLIPQLVPIFCVACQPSPIVGKVPRHTIRNTPDD